MHNLHAGLTGVLAAQRMTERHQQAAHERLLRSARPPRRQRQRVAGAWWRLIWRPVNV